MVGFSCGVNSRLERRYWKLVAELSAALKPPAAGLRALPGAGKAFASTQAMWRFLFASIRIKKTESTCPATGIIAGGSRGAFAVDPAQRPSNETQTPLCRAGLAGRPMGLAGNARRARSLHDYRSAPRRRRLLPSLEANRICVDANGDWCMPRCFSDSAGLLRCNRLLPCRTHFSADKHSRDCCMPYRLSGLVEWLWSNQPRLCPRDRFCRNMRRGHRRGDISISALTLPSPKGGGDWRRKYIKDVDFHRDQFSPNGGRNRP
jgi:hypothetical protein